MNFPGALEYITPLISTHRHKMLEVRGHVPYNPVGHGGSWFLLIRPVLRFALEQNSVFFDRTQTSSALGPLGPSAILKHIHIKPLHFTISLHLFFHLKQQKDTNKMSKYNKYVATYRKKKKTISIKYYKNNFSMLMKQKRIIFPTPYLTLNRAEQIYSIA